MPRFKEPAQLHNHSKYSLLDAVPSPEEWVHWCLENNTPALAITDHGTAISMYDALKAKDFIKEYNKEKGTNHPLDAVTLIPAVELYVKLNAEDKSHFHITAWACSNEGYHNLMKLSSLAFNDTVKYFGSIKGRVTFDMIKQYKAGLKFGTGCIAGPIGRALWDNDKKLAEERFLMYKEIFGDDLYVEFHTNDVTHEFNNKTGTFSPMHGDECSCDGNKQKGYNKFLMEMLDKHGGKAIPVTDAHFIAPEDKIIQDCLLKNGNDNGWYFYESYHQQRAEQMFEKLRTHLGDWLTEDRFKQWIENTYEVMSAAKSINIKFDYHLPKTEIPESIKAKTDDYNMQTYYYTMDRIKAHGRWKDDPVYVERFKKELDVIMKNDTLNFLPYFLVYEDIGSFCRSKGILQGIARGSAGGSLLSYYLKIIHVDPIKANLPFERFLSHARIRAGSFPDIDADIGDTARPLIMEFLKQKYGLGFAQIATFNKIKTKNAIKDAMFAIYGRNRNDPEIKAICDTIPDSPQGVDEHDFLYGFTDKEGHYNEGQMETNKVLIAFFQRHPEVEKMVKKLIGGIRGWSRHASAFVISTLDLSSTRVPTMVMEDKNIGEILVTQYDASMVEKCGLVKADILGIKTLSTTSDCMDLVKARTGEDLWKENQDGVAGVYRLPEDEKVYVDFYNKKTDSSFQFNTPLIKGYIQQFAPVQRGDLSAMTALCRPGALDAPFTNDEISLDDGVSAAQYYIDVRNGKRKLSYLHPDLEKYTTNGVFVYQEEVMKFLVEIAGYTLEESDMVRSAIAKKKAEVIMACFDRIRAATAKRGWTKEQADAVCDQVQAFSRYSFNLSHSHAYGELGYITMYLKNKYPLEWWCSVLNNEDNEDKLRKFITQLGSMVKSPSAKNPSDKFSIVGKHIVAPISAVKSVGPSAVAEIVKNGPFHDIKDFVAKINHQKCNTGTISQLIKARAFDDMMDQTIPYADARKLFMSQYLEARAGKVALKPELQNVDPMSIFLMEKENNRCFNKTLLDDVDITNIIMSKWPSLSKTGRNSIPMKCGDTFVLNGVKIAEGMLANSYEGEVGMFMLFESSSVTTGISKKSGRPWTKLSVMLSDGYNTIECVDWKGKQALRWEKNTIVYVRGELKEGWLTPVSINIREIERVEN